MIHSVPAVFIFARTQNGLWAATTRAADRGESGRIGLPGGKVDPGETLIDAAIRKAGEEGWRIASSVALVLVHTGTIEGRPVYWFFAQGGVATKRSRYKEMGRISPIYATLSDISASGYGNDDAVKSLQRCIQ